MQPMCAMSSGITEQFQHAQNMAAFPPAAHDLLNLDHLLTAEERRTRGAVREFMVNLAMAAQGHVYCGCTLDATFVELM